MLLGPSLVRWVGFGDKTSLSMDAILLIQVIFKVRWAQGTTLKEFESLMDCAFTSVKQYITLRAVKQSLLTFICSIPPSVEGALRRVVEENKQMMEYLGLVVLLVDGEVIWKVCQLTMVMTSRECHSP